MSLAVIFYFSSVESILLSYILEMFVLLIPLKIFNFNDGFFFKKWIFSASLVSFNLLNKSRWEFRFELELFSTL